MGSSLSLRPDYDADTLRQLAKHCRNLRQIHRLLSVAAIYDGMSRTEAAWIGGMDRQTLRDWVVQFNKEGSGCPCRLSETQQAELVEIVDAGSDRDADGVTRWRRIDLQKVIEQRFGVAYSEQV